MRCGSRVLLQRLPTAGDLHLHVQYAFQFQYAFQLQHNHATDYHSHALHALMLLFDIAVFL